MERQKQNYRIGFVIASIYSAKLRPNRLGPNILNSRQKQNYRIGLPVLSVCSGSDSRHSTNLHLDLNSPNRFFRRTMIVPGLPLFLRVAPQGN